MIRQDFLKAGTDIKCDLHVRCRGGAKPSSPKRSKSRQINPEGLRMEHSPIKYIQSKKNASTEVKTNGQIQKRSTLTQAHVETQQVRLMKIVRKGGNMTKAGSRNTGGEKPQIKQEVTHTNRCIFKNKLALNPFGKDNHVEIVTVSQLSR